MPRDASDSQPSAGSLWYLMLRYDEFPVVEAALSGRRLSAHQADQAALISDRLAHLRGRIEDQAKGIGRAG